MARRFNFTGRKKIARADAMFRIGGAGPTLHFDAAIKLADYKLDPKGRVFVEAYRGSTAQRRRFDFGSVGAPVTPDCSLAEFADPDGVLFCVRVTRVEDGIGMLLARADEIKPQTIDTARDPSKSLLDTETRDLGGEAWKIDFTNLTPRLLIDPKVGGKEFALKPEFRALTAPSILREILTRYAVIEAAGFPEDDPDDIRCRWVRFAGTFADGSIPDMSEDSDEDRLNWIDDAVAGFSRRTKVIDPFALSLAMEGQS